MTAFKNRNGNTSPALHNQADLSQRRRGRAAAQQADTASPVQSPATPVQPGTGTEAAPGAGSRRRRQQAAPAPQSQPGQMQAAAPARPQPAAQQQLQTPTQAPAMPQSRTGSQQVVGTDVAPAKSLRRRQHQPEQQATATATPNLPAATPAPAQQTNAPANSPVNPETRAELLAQRTERRQIRIAAPNMTWKALADVPKPDGALNTQMLQVARLIEVGIELAGMVEDENLQMAQGQVRMLSDHQAHKSELSSAYIQTMNSLRAHPPTLKEDNLPMIQFMKEVAARVQTALDTHMSMCRAAMSMTEQLIGKIRKDVAAHDGQELQYKNPLLGGRARRATQERVSAVAHNSLV